MTTQYEKLASAVLFGPTGRVVISGGVVLHASELEPVYGLTYREGKSFADVKAAISKGLKAGKGKIENEEGWIALYLKQVLKPTKEKVCK